MTPARDPKQSFFEKHLRAIWGDLKLMGSIWEASGKHLGSIWETSGGHLWASGISGHLGSGRHLGSI